MVEKNGRRGGRKEILTIDLAREIVKLIERMPDAEIQVNWATIERLVDKKLGFPLKRNVMSSKMFNGQKLIYDAYVTASDVQKTFQKQGTPKYSHSSRFALRQRIQQLEAKVLALKQQLDETRLHQLTALDVYRVTKRDLRTLAGEQRVEIKP